MRSVLPLAVGASVKIDHVIYLVNDLDAAVSHFDATYGIACAEFGEHRWLGTKNALLPVGEDQLLELLAVADATNPVAQLLASMLEVGDGPFTVCLRPRDLDETATRLACPVRDAERPTPTGELVRWRVAGIEASLGPERLPFSSTGGRRSGASLRRSMPAGSRGSRSAGTNRMSGSGLATTFPSFGSLVATQAFGDSPSPEAIKISPSSEPSLAHLPKTPLPFGRRAAAAPLRVRLRASGPPTTRAGTWALLVLGGRHLSEAIATT